MNPRLGVISCSSIFFLVCLLALRPLLRDNDNAAMMRVMTKLLMGLTMKTSQFIQLECNRFKSHK